VILNGLRCLSIIYISTLLLPCIWQTVLIHFKLSWLCGFLFRDLASLASLLCRVASSLGENSYVDYYCRDFPDNLVEFHSLSSATALRAPPCLFRWLENCLRHGCDLKTSDDIPALMCKEKSSAVSWGRKVVSFYSLLLGAERIGKNLSSGVYCEVASGSARNTEELTVLTMVAEKFGRQQLDLLPIGVSLVLRHVCPVSLLFVISWY
jgi:anaphase-promoting complex subunit 1